jgi:hypothetical protein
MRVVVIFSYIQEGEWDVLYLGANGED